MRLRPPLIVLVAASVWNDLISGCVEEVGPVLHAIYGRSARTRVLKYGLNRSRVMEVVHSNAVERVRVCERLICHN